MKLRCALFPQPERILKWLGWFVLAGIACSVRARDPRDYAVLVTADVQSSPASVHLKWPADPYAHTFTVYRKTLDDDSWGTPLAELPSNATGYTDDTVQDFTAYEYQIVEITTDYPWPNGDPAEWTRAFGYIAVGIRRPFEFERGTVVVLIEGSLVRSLASELNQLESDLVGDGWRVIRHAVSSNDDVESVRALVQADYHADPAHVRSVFLIGHIPVPYSGDINPDFHEDHRGAWPADVYYGEMDSAWTDSQVNDASSQYPEIQNVPGDGKFDQSKIPSHVELAVGRVDLWGMPAFAPATETDLLRQYLEKDHRYRHKLFSLDQRGLIRDTFGDLSGDAPATSAWRAFAPFFGPDNIVEAGYNEFFPALRDNSYLWSYGGGGGGFFKADGVGTTGDFAQSDPRTVFMMLHGSYFGDWNNENNLLRAPLATPSYTLACAWVGLPHWFFHRMAVGETIGDSTLLTQNNDHGIYQNNINSFTGEVHIALMGDPTLRMHVVAPPSQLAAAVSADGIVLHWTESPEANLGYGIYRSADPAGPYASITRGYVDGNTFVDPRPLPGTQTYMVRAIKREQSPSGSYDNASQGIFTSIDSGAPPVPEITIQATVPSISENGSEPAVLTLRRDRSPALPLTVNLALSGTAANGIDYQTIGNTVEFASGESTVTIAIRPIPDEAEEGDESVVVQIAASANYQLGTPSQAVVTLVDAPVNHPPTTQDDAASTLSGVPLELAAAALLANDADPDPGDVLQLESVDPASREGGSVGLDGDTVRYTPPPGFSGADQFQYQVSDLQGASATGRVNVTVAPRPQVTGSIKIQDDGQVALQFDLPVNRTYRIEASADLVHWNTVAEGVSESASVRYAQPEAPGETAQFFRIVWDETNL